MSHQISKLINKFHGCITNSRFLICIERLYTKKQTICQNGIGIFKQFLGSGLRKVLSSVLFSFVNKGGRGKNEL